MTTGIPAIDDAIARVAAADKEAETSRLAWSMGPEAFLAYMGRKADEIQKRIEGEYRELDPTAGDSQATSRSGWWPGGSRPGSGLAGSPATVEGQRPARE